MSVECDNNYLLPGYVDTMINSWHWLDWGLFALGGIIKIALLILDDPLEEMRLLFIWLVHLMNCILVFFLQSECILRKLTLYA